jgi:hypothetical protein
LVLIRNQDFRFFATISAIFRRDQCGIIFFTGNWGEVMRFSVVLGLLLLCGCANNAAHLPQQELPAPTMRQFSDKEKAALTVALSQTLKDPESARFKWLPLADYAGTNPVGYCGWVNAKNSYGGYTGFKRFFAMINRGPNGEFSTGSIEHIEERSNPVLDRNASVGDAVTTGLLQGKCKRWGYTEFASAS